MTAKVPMTAKGAQKLKEELTHLKQVERPRIIAAIAEARAHGDLRENAEYHAAKEEQAFIETRVKDIEFKLSHAQVIDVSRHAGSGKVVFGATVVLTNLTSNESVIYQIVGDDEADLKSNKISIGSPIARALIGKEEEDVVEVHAPSGMIEYEITDIQYIVD